MVAPVRKGEQMAASSYRLGGLGSDTISDATGQLHVHLSCPHLPALLHRAMTAATCLVTASPTGLSAGRQQRTTQPFLFQMQWRGREPLHLHRNICHFCAIPTGTCVGAAPVILEAVDRGQTSTRRPAACVLTRTLQGPVHLDTGFQSHLGQFLGKP